MPKLIEKLDRSTDKIHPTVDPITVDKINELLETGDFKGLSHLIREAINELHKKYEMEGKLPPKVLVSRREVTVE
ncbi:hypothetical protein AFULGI_00017070 [Archaeoglobus fulgidus DSM 8774]|uniref:Uncharacterized protein n=1 Tax=Archaeoglobus fulgidus DSM 8774 TaxID=1344584 RepID=A0A075WEP1_ARCFL|nr:hypothetical protein [Archaeoglobus fulgidus]AIG98466.1 hypothetical protein AFULGI_00017070 [Archaeoglobus fulgidus DSM 8774]